MLDDPSIRSRVKASELAMYRTVFPWSRRLQAFSRIDGAPRPSHEGRTKNGVDNGVLGTLKTNGINDAPESVHKGPFSEPGKPTRDQKATIHL